ncbi:MAG TPA: hypothetical protein ENJ65_02945 [Candidatus Tenderia electrophaga]|uniref:Aminoglycoside phosphotransferase domain-containing protein n=1 Tax=Candidatus Tenderia electrophaga TaxID=1748243 RepID=A0A832N6A9_9GAMM|nr:hypothetical protein [Candidatus Tenderia electrophaga]
MSPPPLPRSPAWDKQPPKQAAFVAAAEQTNAIICSHLDIPGPLERLDNNSTGITGFYRSAASKQHPALFIKVVEKKRAGPLLAADPFASFVAKQGVPTPCLIAHYSKDIEKGFFALTYPYFEARFAKPQTSDLTNLGMMAGRLHQALASCPWQQKVQENSEQRQALLFNTLQRIDDSDTAIHQDVIETLRHGSLDYPNSHWPAQIIHGDLNYGNVLFPIQTPDQPLILDFEDTPLSWHSPLVDIAFIIERFILIHSDHEDLAYGLASSLIDSYKQQFSSPLPPIAEGSLFKTLQSLSVRALCLLSALSLKHISSPASEWDKFLFLYYQTQKCERLISKIETLLID